MTCMIAWLTWLVWLVWISLLFLFYFILFYYKYSKSYFLAFWAWENDRHLFGRRINRILKKKGDFVFRGIAHILFPWGNQLQKEKNKKGSGISFLDQRSFFLRGIFLLSLWKSTRELGKGVMAAKTVQVRFWLLSVFLPIFDFSIWSFLNYSMYCWLVWTEKGHKLFCWDWLLACLPCFDFDSFICRWCLLKYVTSCLNLINALFMFKSYSLLSPYPAHGLTYEMEL